MNDAVREDAAAPATLPFPTVSDPPKPVDRIHAYCMVGDQPIHLIGERWRAEDAGASSIPTYPDPELPGLVFGIRVVAAGQEVKSLSRDEYRDLASGHAAGFQSRAQAGHQSY